MRRLAAILPILVLLLAFGGAWAFGLAHALSWQSFAAHEAALRRLVAAHPFVAPVAFTLL